MFKFSIRELLLLTVIVAMGIGWWLRERHFSHCFVKFASLEAYLSAHGYDVEWGETSLRLSSPGIGTPALDWPYEPEQWHMTTLPGQ
jgi:hypothetical protein